jgi:hypothetical protein
LVRMISKTSKNQQFSRKNQWWGRQFFEFFQKMITKFLYKKSAFWFYSPLMGKWVYT